MKKIAGICVLIMFLIPVFSTVSADAANTVTEGDRIEFTRCNTSLIETVDILTVSDNSVKYIDFSIMVDPEEDGYCEITLNGTIETDIGTATFKDFKLRVKGDDCTELALKLLKSFRED